MAAPLQWVQYVLKLTLVMYEYYKYTFDNLLFDSTVMIVLWFTQKSQFQSQYKYTM